MVLTREPGISGIDLQLQILRQYFPGIDFEIDRFIADSDLPPGAEGWVAIPRWQLLAQSYAGAVRSVILMLKKARNGGLDNYSENSMWDQFLRRYPQTEQSLQRIGEEQVGKRVLVVPIQTGGCYGGQSVKNVRKKFESGKKEFGLGLYEICVLLITQPWLMTQGPDLWMFCAGDEISNVTGQFDNPEECPAIVFDKGISDSTDSLIIWTFETEIPSKYYGTPSGFLT